MRGPHPTTLQAQPFPLALSLKSIAFFRNSSITITNIRILFLLSIWMR
jgi:hypothetical protein